ncbi:MAG: hypothetical protein AAB614_00690 [Patescibacteria group bacterium]
MSLSDRIHIQNFLKNKEMNEMYLSVFLMSIAQGLVAIFVPIYLYSLHYSISEILFYYFLISAYFLILTPFLIKIISKIGVKHSIGISIPFHIIYFLGLNIIESLPLLFYILPAILSSSLIFHNIGYHLNYMEHSDSERTEKEVSILIILPVIASIASPFIGGFIAFVFGYSYIYIIGSIILSLSIMPLFVTKDQKEKINFKTNEIFKNVIKKENKFLTTSFMAYAATSTIGIVIWPLFLTTLNISTKIIGFIISVTAISTLFFSYFTSDKRNNIENEKESIKKIYIFDTLGWIGRIFVDSSISAFVVESYKTITVRLLHIKWASLSYNIAKKSDYFRFIVSRELTFNISRVLVIPLFILIFNNGLYPFTITFFIASILSLGFVLIVKHSQ